MTLLMRLTDVRIQPGQRFAAQRRWEYHSAPGGKMERRTFEKGERKPTTRRLMDADLLLREFQDWRSLRAQIEVNVGLAISLISWALKRGT